MCVSLLRVQHGQHSMLDRTAMDISLMLREYEAIERTCPIMRDAAYHIEKTHGEEPREVLRVRMSYASFKDVAVRLHSLLQSLKLKS